MQENNFNQLLTLINEIDNFKNFNTVETQLQIVRKKLEKNKEENILKSIKDALEAAGVDGNIAKRYYLIVGVGRHTLLVCKSFYHNYLVTIRNESVKSGLTRN